MLIFRRIFLSNYWWQKSDIWSQASYRYPISWEAILNPSDSYFLFADFVDFYTHWTYILYMPIFSRIFLSNYWWQKSNIWSSFHVANEDCCTDERITCIVIWRRNIRVEPVCKIDPRRVGFYRWRHVTKNRSMRHGSVVTFDTVCLILFVSCVLSFRLSLRLFYVFLVFLISTSRHNTINHPL
jgi:hypothetical protein